MSVSQRQAASKKGKVDDGHELRSGTGAERDDSCTVAHTFAVGAANSDPWQFSCASVGKQNLEQFMRVGRSRSSGSSRVGWGISKEVSTPPRARVVAEAIDTCEVPEFPWCRDFSSSGSNIQFGHAEAARGAVASRNVSLDSLPLGGVRAAPPRGGQVEVFDLMSEIDESEWFESYCSAGCSLAVAERWSHLVYLRLHRSCKVVTRSRLKRAIRFMHVRRRHGGTVTSLCDFGAVVSAGNSTMLVELQFGVAVVAGEMEEFSSCIDGEECDVEVLDVPLYSDFGVCLSVKRVFLLWRMQMWKEFRRFLILPLVKLMSGRWQINNGSLQFVGDQI